MSEEERNRQAERGIGRERWECNEEGRARASEGRLGMREGVRTDRTQEGSNGSGTGRGREMRQGGRVREDGINRMMERESEAGNDRSEEAREVDREMDTESKGG